VSKGKNNNVIIGDEKAVQCNVVEIRFGIDVYQSQEFGLHRFSEPTLELCSVVNITVATSRMMLPSFHSFHNNRQFYFLFNYDLRQLSLETKMVNELSLSKLKLIR